MQSSRRPLKKEVSTFKHEILSLIRAENKEKEERNLCIDDNPTVMSLIVLWNFWKGEDLRFLPHSFCFFTNNNNPHQNLTLRFKATNFIWKKPRGKSC